jgi:hypothetical protein
LLSFLKGTSTYVGHVSMSAYYLHHDRFIYDKTDQPLPLREDDTYTRKRPQRGYQARPI